MTDSPPPAVGDQEPGPIALLARLFLTQLLAVLAIATVIALAFSFLGLDDRSSVETTTRQDSGSSSTGSGPAGGTPPAESTPPPSSAPPSSAPPTTTPAVPASPSPSTTGAAAVARVDVLNQSGGSGIAESTAAGLRDRGWRIGRVDNFNGNVRTTTIYFPPGLRSEARDLAAEFESEPRILPAFSTLASGRLTVILVG